MRRTWAYRAVLAGVLGLSLMASACGSSGGGSPSSATKETVTIGGFNFSESSLLAYVYGEALQGQGYTVNYKLNLGPREVVEPALVKGDLDMYLGYTATDLLFQNPNATATASATENAAKLNAYLKPKGLEALTPAPATDENAFAVLRNGPYGHYRKLSQLVPVAPQMVLGGPPECATRPFCLPGLERVYGLHFKGFTALDAGGPLTKAALDHGQIQIGLIFSSDPSYQTTYVELQDDRHLQDTDAVVPIGRSRVFTPAVVKILDGVSAKLTTPALIGMNEKVDVEKDDPNQVAYQWLTSAGIKAPSQS
jgi:osmoprotectant transport system substrate-binding protein